MTSVETNNVTVMTVLVKMPESEYRNIIVR